MHDPAVLFYPADFLIGASDLTNEEVGQYIKLLCLQHQKGPLSKKIIALSVGAVSDDVMSKFQVNDQGLYYNERMAQEIAKRAAYTASRRKNGSKGGRPKKDTQPIPQDPQPTQNPQLKTHNPQPTSHIPQPISQDPKDCDPSTYFTPNPDAFDWQVFMKNTRIHPKDLSDAWTTYRAKCISEDLIRTRKQHHAAFTKWCISWSRNLEAKVLPIPTNPKSLIL